jgi:hypothetical protein
MATSDSYYLTQEQIDKAYEADFIGLSTPGWYFTDETEAFAHGPFATQDECDASLVAYGILLSEGFYEGE